METSPPPYKVRAPMSIPRIVGTPVISDESLISRILDERSKLMDERSKLLDERSKLLSLQSRSFGNDYNKVYTHTSGGSLYIGNKKSLDAVISKKLKVDLVCTMFSSKTPEIDGVEFITEHVDDRPNEAPTLMNIAKTMSESIIFYLESGKNVLVRCHMGISRSAGVVLYTILSLHPEKTYQDAITDIQEHRPCVCPNPGFEFALATHFCRDE